MLVRTSTVLNSQKLMYTQLWNHLHSIENANHVKQCVDCSGILRTSHPTHGIRDIYMYACVLTVYYWWGLHSVLFINQYPDHTPKFDPYINDDWQSRHLSIQRFVQAGRRVIIRLRCQERLQKLRSILKAGEIPSQPVATESIGEDKVISVAGQLPKSTGHILPFSFPKYFEQEDTVSCTSGFGRNPTYSC